MVVGKLWQQECEAAAHCPTAGKQREVSDGADPLPRVLNFLCGLSLWTGWCHHTEGVFPPCPSLLATALTDVPRGMPPGLSHNCFNQEFSLASILCNHCHEYRKAVSGRCDFSCCHRELWGEIQAKKTVTGLSFEHLAKQQQKINVEHLVFISHVRILYPVQEVTTLVLCVLWGSESF